MSVTGETMVFRKEDEKKLVPSMVLQDVYKALEEKGYDPITQIAGYLLSGDPTYITSYNDARSNIRRIERDELIEELVRYYVTNRGL